MTRRKFKTSFGASREELNIINEENFSIYPVTTDILRSPESLCLYAKTLGTLDAARLHTAAL